MVTSKLVTDVGDQMCWGQVWDVGDKSRHQYKKLSIDIKAPIVKKSYPKHIGQQHFMLAYYDVDDPLECHKQAKNIINILCWRQHQKIVTIIKSRTKRCHQDLSPGKS